MFVYAIDIQKGQQWVELSHARKLSTAVIQARGFPDRGIASRIRDLVTGKVLLGFFPEEKGPQEEPLDTTEQLPLL